MATKKRTPLEEVLDRAKDDEQQAVADIYYSELDDDTKARANYAYMYLVEYVNIRNMGEVSSAELAIKLTRFIDVITRYIEMENE